MVNNEPRNPVGVFDSGLGGLTVVAEIWRQLPSESVIYFGDTARVPYGGRPAEEIQEFNREIIKYLQAAGAKAIVMACNTSTALALDSMKREFALPLIGVIEPGAREAAKATRNGQIGLMATEGTIRSRAYERAITALSPGSKVHPVSCPRLVPLIESGRMQSAETRQALEEYLFPLVADGVDTLILGCTHYPFLTDQIRAIVGEDVRLVNPALATAAELQESLVESGLVNNHTKGPDRLTTSGDPASFQRLGERLLARRLPACRKVQVTVDAGVSVG